MINENIRWYAVSRNDLLDVLLGEYRPDNSALADGRLAPHPVELKEGFLSLAYQNDLRSRNYLPPAIMLLGDKAVAETLSWLRVYAAESAPLSQFARVITAEDWQIFNDGKFALELDRQRPDFWASVVLGEAISQGDGDIDLNSMALSRALGCYSMTFARSAITHGFGQGTSLCVDRLRSLEGERRFSRRPVSIDNLLPIWLISSMPNVSHPSAQDAAMMVCDAAQKEIPGMRKSNRSVWLDSLRQSGLASDSVEARVVAFNRLAIEVISSEAPENEAGFAAVTLAAAAFLVGRGTSHFFLLKRFASMVPTAPAWFGLMAAVVGPRGWDASWIRAAKGVEKILRPEFNWLEPSTADLSWTEFSWICANFENPDVFLSLPKMLPRTLALEVVPGAVCQLRLNMGVAEEPAPLIYPQTSPRERALEDAVAQFVKLAKKVAGLTGAAPENPQLQMPLDEVVSRFAKPKSQRGRRDDGRK